MEPLLEIAVVATLLIAISEAVKRTVNAWAATPPDPDRYVPALTVVLGVSAGAGGLIIEGGWVAGLIAALTAMGTYSGGKATVSAVSRDRFDDEDGGQLVEVGFFLVCIVVVVLVLSRIVG